MTLQAYLEDIKSKKSKNDSIRIYATEKVNDNLIDLEINDLFIEKHPIILQANLINYGVEDTQTSDFFAKTNYKTKLYYAQVDLKQYKEALNS